jgi:uncharacterized protein YcbX
MTSTISKLFRFPVKSMGGESLSTLSLTQRGTVGDRVWAVRDEVRGGIRGGKKIPSLMQLNARFIGEVATEGSSPALISATDGSERETGADDINAWLSQQLDHEVTLWPLLPADALDHYRRGAPDNEDFEQEMRDMFARTEDEPLPDLTLFAEVLEYESPPGTYFDAFPILLMTEQSLRSMTAHRPDSNFHVNRFRPNLLIDAADATDPFPENNWVGKQIRIGEVLLETVGECPRCAMTTHGFGDLPKDPGIMRALVQANGGNIGVYARVLEGGTVNLGDKLEL